MKKLGALEALRGLCALYVFMGHLALNGVQSRPDWSSVFRFGQEAVIIFFLMSGFVINLSIARHPDQSFFEFFKRRFLRIYPIFILAIVLGFCLAYPLWGPNEAISLPTLGGNLLMLQDFKVTKPGVWITTFAGNSPLWSLSYEWWFYMMFWPIKRYVAKPLQAFFVAGLSIVGLVLAFSVPSQPAYFLLYFTIWWAGVSASESYLMHGKVGFRGVAVSYLAVGGLAAPT